jgi:DNA-binding NarL/FixJ family response regulator
MTNALMEPERAGVTERPEWRQPIPAGAYNVGAQLLASEDGVDSHPPRARVHLGQGVWLALRAARIVEAHKADADIAVTLEPTSINERTALFSLAHGHSKREAEIVAACARGTGTRGLAEELFVSENTIQDHFKSIFARTGTRTRGELLATARGKQPHGGRPPERAAQS